MCAVRTQNSVWQGRVSNRNGPSAKDPAIPGARLVFEWLHSVVQGELRSRRPGALLNPHCQLETDRELIIPKARTALERYGHQVVIGNDLHTRKQEVVFVQKDTAEVLRLSDDQLQEGVEIEREIVRKLADMHQHHIVNAISG